ncbi:MAG: MATE family efflux transporter [Treponema sp.]|nr:MATE family efflux transporter [Treponema sp.]
MSKNPLKAAGTLRNIMMFTNKQLKALILPLVIEQLLAMLVGIADTIMISIVGEAAISGVLLVDMLNYFVIVVFSALATGGAVIVSQYLGNADRGNANKAAGQLITIAFIFSFSIGVCCLLLHESILRLLFGSVENDVMNAAKTYFFISSLSFPFLGIYNAQAALYRSMAKTGVTMYISLLMNVINVFGNAIGIFVFRAGVAGVAVPTLIARMTAALLLTGLAARKSNTVFITIKNILSFQKDMARRILCIAIPNGIENGLFQFGRILVTSIVALFGTSQIAANGVAGSVDMIAIIVVNSVNLGVITVVGQCVGGCEYDQAAYYTKKLMIISYIATGILGLAVILLLPLILRLYSLSAETARMAGILIVTHNILAFLLHPTSFVLCNTLKASGDVKFSMYAAIASMLAFRLGCAYFLGIILNMGLIGVWIAMGMDWTGRSICYFLRYKSGKWKNYRAIYRGAAIGKIRQDFDKIVYIYSCRWSVSYEQERVPGEYVDYKLGLLALLVLAMPFAARPVFAQDSRRTAAKWLKITVGDMAPC